MIKKTTYCLIVSFLVLSWTARAQTADLKETEQITETLMKYIDGTANGEPEKLKEAFHPDFNLYSRKENDSLNIWSGKDYIEGIEEGVKVNRTGRILSIDFEKDVATAKAEIVVPNWRIFTDYFLLVKYEGSWKIIHKSYTSREIPNTE